MSAITTYERAIEAMTRTLRDVAAAALADEQAAWEQAILTRANNFKTHAAFLRRNCGHLEHTESIAKTEEACADAMVAIVVKLNMERGDRGGLLPKGE